MALTNDGSQFKRFLLLNARRQRNINDVYQIALESLEKLKNDRVLKRFSKKETNTKNIRHKADSRFGKSGLKKNITQALLLTRQEQEF